MVLDNLSGIWGQRGGGVSGTGREGGKDVLRVLVWSSAAAAPLSVGRSSEDGGCARGGRNEHQMNATNIPLDATNAASE